MGSNVRKDNRRNKKPTSPGIEQRNGGESSLTWAEYWRDLKKFAFGWMCLRPHEFYELDNEDFFLGYHGHKEMIIDRKRDLRRMALIIVSPHVKDMPSAMKIWPIENDDELKGEVERARTVDEHNKNFSKLISIFKNQHN